MIQKIKDNPELLFLCSILFYWFSTSFLNPFAIFLLVIALIMVFVEAKILRMIVGALYGFVNSYLVLALISEFNEFPEVNSQALVLLSVGTAFITFNLFVSVILIIKNIPSVDTLESAV